MTRSHTPGLRVTATLAALLVPAVSAHAQTERTAGETYKNVQVLKDVPASIFMNTMFFQRYSLGVSCNYCHVGAEWARDDKPQKLKAREMLRMVLDINKSHFDGKVAVNCMTCHRGLPKPQTDIVGKRTSIQEMLGPRPTQQPQPSPVLPAVDDVLAKYIAAIGGADALSKIRSRATRGNMITGEGAIVPFEDTWAAAPASTLSIRHFGGSLGDFATGFDGTAGWNSDNRGFTPQAGQAKAQLEMNAQFEDKLNLRKLYAELTVTGIEPVNDAPAIVLSAKSVVTGRAERLYFDVATGLLVRRSIVTEGLFGSFTTDTYYENYRTVDGVTLPIMISEFTPDFGTIRKITSVEHNGTIDRAVFTRSK
ncbi:MAG TPA: c-type cytochrome [Gemmatimonadaceae bacterium]|nr:c-type cytochrome [Gemmatimonadaceae bacterium]